MAQVAQQMTEFRRPFGGQYVPESLVESLEDLQCAFQRLWVDATFQQDFHSILASIRPPSRLQLARNLTKLAGGAQIYLKREDLSYTGSHSIVNALGQALLAQRLKKTTVLAETGSGCHGLATAAVCKMLGLECVVYMGIKDAQARPEKVKGMQMYGAKVIEVSTGEGTIREAVTEVFRAAVEQIDSAYPLLGGSYGPRPLPMIANAFQSIIGAETKTQAMAATGRVPSKVVACAGIHSPGVGFFDAFVDNHDVQLVAVESGGCSLASDLHAAVLTQGSCGVYHGAHTMVLQDEHGQIDQVHSIAPDLCYPGVSPSLAKWNADGRVKSMAIADDEAVIGCVLLSKAEKILSGIEDGHSVAAGVTIARNMSPDETVVICLGGGL